MEKAKIALFTLDTGKRVFCSCDDMWILNASCYLAKMKESITKAKELNETGGDWDRRNRLKVYEALYFLHIRDVHEASKLLLDGVATFSCTELCTYNQFIFYVLTTSIITLDRNDLRKKVIKDPHVITAIRDLPVAQQLVQGIYSCDYKSFFNAVRDFALLASSAVNKLTRFVLQIIAISEELLSNRFLGPLHQFLVREYRVLAYKQFLEAYKSVMLSSMAASFGLPVTLLDAELSRFIAAGRLNAKIDKVGNDDFFAWIGCVYNEICVW